MPSKIRAMPRWQTIVIGSSIASVLIAGAVTTTMVLTAKPDPAVGTGPAIAAVPETPKVSPPETMSVAATFAGWTLESAIGVQPAAETGKIEDGNIALLLNADIAGAADASAVLSQLVPVIGGLEYEFRALVRLDSASSGTGSVAIMLGEQQLDLPAPAPAWTEVTGMYTAEPGQTEMRLAIAASGDVAGFRIDAITLAPIGETTNAVLNGSFEDFAAPTQITNPELIMRTGEAYIGVSWRAATLSWEVLSETGAALLDGTLPANSSLNLIPLGDLEQGYYSVSVAPEDGSAEPITATFMVLDQTTIPAGERDSRFGVGTHIGEPYYVGSETVGAQIGFAHARTDARWSHIEKVKGVYDYPQILTDGVRDFEAAGMDMLPIVGYGNKLYDAGAPSTPDGIAAYVSLASNVVSTFDAHALEVFNEFNNPLLNTGACGTTPACYLPILQATADRIRAEYPGIPIVGPANARTDDAFLTGLYQLGGLDYLDAVSFHPYDYDYGDNKGAEFLVDSLKQVEDRIKEYNDGEAKPIWITELGWTSTLVESDNQQADYLVRSEVIAFASGVERFYWYDLVNDHLHPLDHEGNFGMVRQQTEQIPAFEPKRSAMAQSMLIRKIGGKDFAVRDNLNETTYSYAFGSSDDTTRVAWSTKPVSVSFATKVPVKVTSQYGEVTVVKPINGTITIELGEQTIYIDGDLSVARLIG
ncbi:glycoside hydrolase family protein [Microterricola viridarii]|uniref:hypothetical protein n=1 Tax=Microterricola viridarii TaxID=412690 RepID=UPI001560973F|nr:hypothetical protein [Microterricola viridarii]